MCPCRCLINSLNEKNFAKLSIILNILIILINSLIIIINLSCFFFPSLELIIKTGVHNYINNIFYPLIILSIIILIIYYRQKKQLQKKKRVSMFLFLFCFFFAIFQISSNESSSSLLKSLYKETSKKGFDSNEAYKKFKKETSFLSTSLSEIICLYVLLEIFLLVYFCLIYNLRIVLFQQEFNDNFRDFGNINNLSTGPDINDDSQEIVINNLNAGSKNNNFYFFSEKIINGLEKTYEDKEIQTNIKGLRYK